MSILRRCIYGAIGTVAVFLAGCSSVFTGFSPLGGAVCDEVRITRENGHLCGTHIVEFNGVRAVDVRLEPRPATGVIAVVPPGATTGPLTIRQVGTMGCVIMGMFDSGLFDLGTFSVTGSPSAPQIASLTAVPGEIDEGEASTLQWSVSGTVSRLELYSAGDGTVNLTGATSYAVAPDETTEYRLTAFNRCVTASRTRTVLVNEAQEQPEVMSIDSGYPGESVTVDGENLRYRPRDDLPYVDSSLIFAQGGTTYSPVEDASPSDTRLEGNLPEGIDPGDATVRARVGTLESEAVDFTVAGREDGAFGAPTLITSGSQTCTKRGITRTLEISGAGEERYATFEEEGTRLWRQEFALGTSGTGAGFSGDCMHGVIVGQNTSVADNKFTLHIRDLAADATRISETSMGQGVQVLFSPDDSVVLYKGQDDFRGVGFAVIHLYDMREHGSVPDPGTGVACTSCNSVSASVVDYRDVEITFSGEDYGPYAIE